MKLPMRLDLYTRLLIFHQCCYREIIGGSSVRSVLVFNFVKSFMILNINNFGNTIERRMKFNEICEEFHQNKIYLT